jgi:hypothetical protein
MGTKKTEEITMDEVLKSVGTEPVPSKKETMDVLAAHGAAVNEAAIRADKEALAGGPLPVKVTSNGNITQSSLKYYMQIKREAEDIERALKEKKKMLSLLDEDLKAAVAAGKKTTPGDGHLRVEVKRTEKRYPKWKEHALGLAEQLKFDLKAYEAEVKEATEPRVSEKVRVY